MKVETDDRFGIVLKELYNGVTIITNNGERLFVCMRDSGFEVVYGEIKYILQNEKIKKLKG